MLRLLDAKWRQRIAASLGLLFWLTTGTATARRPREIVSLGVPPWAVDRSRVYIAHVDTHRRVVGFAGYVQTIEGVGTGYRSGLFVYEDGTWTLLDDLVAGAFPSSAEPLPGVVIPIFPPQVDWDVAANDAGQIALVSRYDGVTPMIYDQGALVAIPKPPGLTNVQDIQINDQGSILGLFSGAEGPWNLFLPAGGSPTELPESFDPSVLGDGNEIVGWDRSDVGTRLAILMDGTVRIIEPPASDGFPVVVSPLRLVSSERRILGNGWREVTLPPDLLPA